MCFSLDLSWVLLLRLEAFTLDAACSSLRFSSMVLNGSIRAGLDSKSALIIAIALNQLIQKMN